MQKEKSSVLGIEKSIALKKAKTSRLAFSSKQKVNTLLLKLSNENLSKSAIKNKIIKAADGKSSKIPARYAAPEEFYSFYDYEQDLVNNGMENEWNDISTNTSVDNDTYTLIPDENFAQVLNADMKIEADNKIYKVTEYGTFVIDPSKYNEAISYINNLDIQSVVLTPSNRMLPNETEIEEDYYQILPGINRFDTYKDFEATEYNSTYIPPSYTGQSNNTTFNPMDIVLPTNVSNSNVKFTNYTNSKVFFNYSSDRRMRANFQDYDFFVVNLASLEVAFQKKGFLGIWSSTNAQELGIDINYFKYIRRAIEDYDQYSLLIPNQFYSYPERNLVNANYNGSTIRYIPREPGTLQTDDRIEYILKDKHYYLSSASKYQISLVRPRGWSEGLKPYIYTSGAALDVNIATYVKYNNIWKSIYYHSSESTPL